MTENITKKSIDIFTRWPHGDRTIDEIARAVGAAIEKGGNPLTKPGLAFNRLFDVKGKRVLDAGCGSGIKAFLTAAYGAEFVIGLDGSPVAIDRARKVQSILGLSNLEFINGTIEELPGLWEGRSPVHLVVNLQNLHHTDD